MSKIKTPKGVDKASPSSKPPLIPIGVYDGKIMEVNQRESRAGNDMLEVIAQITKGKFKTRKLFYYVMLESDDGDTHLSRIREFLEATGIVKPGAKKVPASFDPDGTIGTEIKIKTRIEKDLDGDDVGRIARLLPGDAEDESEEDDADDAEDEEEQQDYSEMETEELKEELAGRDIKLDGKFSKKKAIAALEAEDESEEEADDDDEDVDLDELNRKQLKAYIKENDLDVKVTSKMDEDDIRAAIVDAEDEDEEEDEEDDDVDDDEDAPDYDAMETQALKDLCKERGLSPKGKKSILAARLRKDDENDGDDPF